MDTYILKKSNRKGKRFVIEMPTLKHKHHFGSDVGKTFIDHGDLKKKSAWESRHKLDKGYNDSHSGIYFSRFLLWGKNTDLKKNIKDLESKLNVKIKY
tara:strand:+ start:294 stop:587 length:294 start_codon:yes stop_codon:yes gene_type:complete